MSPPSSSVTTLYLSPSLCSSVCNLLCTSLLLLLDCELHEHRDIYVRHVPVSGPLHRRLFWPAYPRYLHSLSLHCCQVLAQMSFLSGGSSTYQPI